MRSQLHEGDQTPSEVRKLIQKEKKQQAREEFYNLFEQWLDDLGLKHRGLSMPRKMACYSVEAFQTLKHWAKSLGIPYVYLNTPWNSFKTMMETKQFCDVFDERLMCGEKQYSGMSLEQKMKAYPVEAWNVIREWSQMHKQPFYELDTPWESFCSMMYKEIPTK